ncbi:hypothetical protein Scep_024065 [Stephania cephalantha]|uniref:Uncharacterized protein n=1 Tax=Stephania cephalantha TaxID=152367 RepID=A0AAP0HY32_9MAGN
MGRERLLERWAPEVQQLRRPRSGYLCQWLLAGLQGSSPYPSSCSRGSFR